MQRNVYRRAIHNELPTNFTSLPTILIFITMRKLCYILSICLLIACGSKQEVSETVATPKVKKPDPTQNQVTMVLPDIKGMTTVEKTIGFLASDVLQGRDTGSLGIEMAAQFIEARFENAGVQPYFDSYRDDFTVKTKPIVDKNTGKSVAVDDVKAFNIVGMIEGSDPALKKEVIIIGAHYDHIGYGKKVAQDSIANGANDNAAGTTTVLALADHFAKAKTNKRTLLFTLYSAEERGLLGSKHLSQRLKKSGLDLYTMFNIEMVGVPMKDRDHLVYCSGYDKSNIAEKFNGYAGEKVIGFLPKAQEFRLFMRSDNYPFFLDFGVPAHTISSFDFTNFEHYHGVGDEADQMDIVFMEGLIEKLIPGIEGMANSASREIAMNSIENKQ